MKLIRLFSLCYRFLLYMSKNDNIQNKQIISKYLDVIMHHLSLEDIGQNDLISELFKDGYNTDSNKVAKIYQKFIQIVM